MAVEREVVINLSIAGDDAAKKKAQGVGDEVEKTGKKAKKTASEVEKAIEAAQKKHEDAMGKVAASQEAVGNSTKALLDGTMSVAQGFVTLGVLSEDSLEQVVKGLVRVNAVFNIFKGGITIFFEARKALVAYRDAIMAAETANKALATAQKAVAAGQALQAGGSAAGMAAKGAASAAAGGAASVAGGAAGGIASSGLAAAAGAAGIVLAKLAALIAIVTAASDLLQSGLTRLAKLFGLTSRSGETMTGALLGWWKASKDAATSTENLTKSEEKRAKRLQQVAEANAKAQKESQFRATVRAEANDSKTRRDEAMASYAKGRVDRFAPESMKKEATGKIDEVVNERNRLRAIAEVQQAQAELASAEQKALERKQRGEFAVAEEMIAAQQRMLEATRQRADAEQRVVEAAKSRLDTQKQLVDSLKSELETARSSVEAEQDKVKSAKARFAQLGKGDRAKLKEISERLKSGGELTEADAAILKRTGIGADKAEDFYTKKGEGLGADDILSGLGEKDGLTKAEKERDDVQQKLTDAQRKVIELQERRAQAEERYINSLEELSKANAEKLTSEGDRDGVDTSGIEKAFQNSVDKTAASMNSTVEKQQANGGAI